MTFLEKTHVNKMLYQSPIYKLYKQNQQKKMKKKLESNSRILQIHF